MDILGSQAPQDQNPTGLTNDFATIPDVSIEQLAETQRVQPRDVATGVARGTQAFIVNDSKLITVGDIETANNTNVIANLGRDVKDASYGLRVFDDSNSRLLAGKYPNGDIKIKLSQPTYDVETATDAQLIWSSDFNMFKIVKTGTYSLDITDPLPGGSSNTATIAHGASTTPIFLVYAQIPAGTGYVGQNQLSQLPVYLIGSNGAIANGLGLVFGVASASVDATNLYIKFTNPTTSNQTGYGTPWVFRYYIMQETAASS